MPCRAAGLHSLQICFRSRAPLLWVLLCFGKVLGQSNSAELGMLAAAPALFRRANVAYGTPLIFPVQFVTFVALEFILNRCPVQSRGCQKFLSLLFPFPRFVKAFYFPLCWALFPTAACWGGCHFFRPQTLQAATEGSPLRSMPIFCPSYSSCFGWPWPQDLGTTPSTQLPLLTLLSLTRGTVDFETGVCYAEQGLSQMCQSPFPSLWQVFWATADASRKNCELTGFLSHPVVGLVTAVTRGAGKCSKGEDGEGGKK